MIGELEFGNSSAGKFLPDWRETAKIEIGLMLLASRTFFVPTLGAGWGKKWLAFMMRSDFLSHESWLVTRVRTCWNSRMAKALQTGCSSPMTMALTTACRREQVLNLLRMLLKWKFSVASEQQSIRLISQELLPAAHHLRHSSSRGVRVIGLLIVESAGVKRCVLSTM